MVDAPGRPLVVGIVPGQPELVALTAASWGRAIGSSMLYFAYADPTRAVLAEHPDGSIDHAPVDPDGADDGWRAVQTDIEHFLGEVLHDVPWQFRYLAGRADRALTHLARAVDAAGFVVGTRPPGPAARVRHWLDGSVAVHLTHHQHRPVLVVPLQVIDWTAPSPWA